MYIDRSERILITIKYFTQYRPFLRRVSAPPFEHLPTVVVSPAMRQRAPLHARLAPSRVCGIIQST